MKRHVWVLTDRIDFANDNGEHLFRYLQENRPNVKSVYVLSSKAPDWDRLRKEFGGAVVAFGSLRWLYFVNRARVIISSHLGPRIFMKERWARHLLFRARFVYLGHGVGRGDKLRVLSQYPIDLFLVSSREELEHYKGAESQSRLHSTRVVRTGLARWDRLRFLADQRALNQSDLILLAPTWRLGPWIELPGFRLRRPIQIALLRETEWYKNWLELCNSTQLRELARKSGQQVVFLLHPAFSALLRNDETNMFGAHVRVESFFGSDAQQLICQSSVLITDYSSVAHDAALIGVPIVYFHFEGQVSNGNVMNSFVDLESHGIGPVATDLEGVVYEVAELSLNGFVMAAEFFDRRGEFVSGLPAEIRPIVTQEIESLLMSQQPSLAKVKCSSKNSSNLQDLD
tara:strand:+ start:3925 stop:5124 length:1200 start_codon:yes stop_codon:yes gene_type:complete